MAFLDLMVAAGTGIASAVGGGLSSLGGALGIGAADAGATGIASAADAGALGGAESAVAPMMSPVALTAGSGVTGAIDSTLPSIAEGTTPLMSPVAQTAGSGVTGAINSFLGNGATNVANSAAVGVFSDNPMVNQAIKSGLIGAAVNGGINALTGKDIGQGIVQGGLGGAIGGAGASALGDMAGAKGGLGTLGDFAANNPTMTGMGISALATPIIGSALSPANTGTAQGSNYPHLTADFNPYVNYHASSYPMTTGFADGGEVTEYRSGGTIGSFSDGGQLLKGDGDGVSDSIPAVIGGVEPARLADGEFVVPARIVSELGNGSTEAGSRRLYEMVDRIQHGRKETLHGKDYAKDTKPENHLPA